jgi:hypothetical protein
VHLEIQITVTLFSFTFNGHKTYTSLVVNSQKLKETYNLTNEEIAGYLLNPESKEISHIIT